MGRIASIIFCCFALAPFSAIAGPPFRTDDPEPVDYGHYEFYNFFSGTHVTGDRSGVGPAFELNYGLIPDGQFHVVAPLAFDNPSGSPSQFGIGDTEIGFKYRFIQEDEKRCENPTPRNRVATRAFTYRLCVAATNNAAQVWIGIGGC
jgi:subtilisin family serine protease